MKKIKPTLQDGVVDVIRETLRVLRPIVASNPKLMNSVADSVVQALRNRFADYQTPTDQAAACLAEKFLTEGFLSLGVLLGRDEIVDINNFFNSREVDFKSADVGNLGRGSPQNRPDNAYWGMFSQKDVIDCPHLLRLANSPAIVGVVRQFLQFLPIIDSVTAWDSYSGVRDAGFTQILHRDKDCFRFCKLFVYLTDVDENSGPHVYLPASHRLLGMTELVNSHGLNINPAELFVGGQRNRSLELENWFSENFVRLVGPAGSAFLVNTYGLHRGEVPKFKDRRIFQALYSLLPWATDIVDVKNSNYTDFENENAAELRYQNQNLYVR